VPNIRKIFPPTTVLLQFTTNYYESYPTDKTVQAGGFIAVKYDNEITNLFCHLPNNPDFLQPALHAGDSLTSHSWRVHFLVASHKIEVAQI